jgi:hypothetical protein
MVPSRVRIGGRSHQFWTREEMEELVRMARAGMLTWVIARALSRPAKSVRNKASLMGVALGGERSWRPRDPRRLRVQVTVDFDFTTLSEDERRDLAKRLLESLPEREVVIPEPWDASAEGKRRWEATLVPEEERQKRYARQRARKKPKVEVSRNAERREQRWRKIEAWYRRKFGRLPEMPAEFGGRELSELTVREQQRVLDGWRKGPEGGAG